MSRKLTQNLNDYLNGNMDDKSKKIFQQKMAEDKFLFDATEGLEAFPGAGKNIEEVKRKINSKKSGRASSSSKLMLIATILLFVVAVCLSLYRMFSHKEEKPVEEKIKKAEKISSILISNEEIVKAVPMDSQHQIRYSTAVKYQTIPGNLNNNQFEPITKIEARKVKKISSDNLSVTEKEIDKKRIATSNHPLIYIYNLKVLDYSRVYNNNVHKMNASGLEPKYENNLSQNNNMEADQSYVTYKSFLTSSLEKFKNNDFKNSLLDLAVILKHFPEDLNAFFYGGLCLYNLQKFDKAIVYFNNAIESPINSFYQEARWYKALSLIKQSDKDNAKKLLNEIIDEDGFYKKNAEEIIKTLQ